MNKLIISGILMGIGMGGFLDGILLHQIFQTHSMLSARLPQDTVTNIKISMVWDGLFHMLTWIATAISIKLLWNEARSNRKVFSGIAFWGSLFTGWGLFNLIEGIINHHMLGIHHVNELSGLSVYDYFFLASGILFIGFGRVLISKGKKDIITTASPL